MEQNVGEMNALCVATTGEREGCKFTGCSSYPIKSYSFSVRSDGNLMLLKLDFLDLVFPLVHL